MLADDTIPSVYAFNCVLANPMLVLVWLRAPKRYTVLASTVEILVFCAISTPETYEICPSVYAFNCVLAEDTEELIAPSV